MCDLLTSGVFEQADRVAVRRVGGQPTLSMWVPDSLQLPPN
jgi:hypothetical protein